MKRGSATVLVLSRPNQPNHLSPMCWNVLVAYILSIEKASSEKWAGAMGAMVRDDGRAADG